MESQNATAKNSQITNYLADIGFTLCDFVNMPIKKRNPNDEQAFVAKMGFIKVVPVKVRKLANNTKAQTSISLPVVWDKDDMICYGQPLGFSNGNVRWKRVFIDDERQFNLSKVADRRDFYMILHDSRMQGGPRFNGQAAFKMEDPEQTAKEVVAKRMTARIADDIVFELSNPSNVGDLADFAVLFGINPAQSNSVILAQLYEKADSDSAELVKRWEDPDRKIWSMVKKAVMYGIFNKAPDGLYYGGIALGASEINAVERVKQTPEIYTTILDKINAKLGNGVSAAVVIPVSKKSEEQVHEASKVVPEKKKKGFQKKLSEI